MDIVVKSRHHEVTDRFRRHVMEKLAKVQEMDDKAISLTVVLGEEKNPRQSEQKDRIELTLDCPGPVIRAEACAGDPYSALDLAAAKLQAQIRKAKDRRKIRRNRKAIAESIKHLPADGGPAPGDRAAARPTARPTTARATQPRGGPQSLLRLRPLPGRARWWCARRRTPRPR